MLFVQESFPSVPSTDTLAEAVLWDYRFVVYYDGGLSFDVTFNEERTVSYTAGFEDTGGVTEVRVTASAGELPLAQYDSERTTWTITIPRLDALDVQSARASTQGIAFPNPLLPFVESSEPITLGGAPASLETHLTAMLQTLLGNSPFASQPMSLECRYGYEIGGVPIEAPVVLVTRQDVAIGFAEELVAMIAGSIQQWKEAVQPPSTDARLIFALTFWSAIARTDAPLLRLTQVYLPMASVV
jgi:hypothetical protein